MQIAADNKSLPKPIFFIVLLVGFLVLSSFFMPTICVEKEGGKRARCLNNLRQIGLAFALYAEDERPKRLTDLTKYLGGDSNCTLFMCPSVIRNLKTEPPKRISELPAHPEFFNYDYLSATSLTKKPVYIGIEPILCDKPANHGTNYINILMADGHVIRWNGTLQDYARSNSLSITVVTNWVQ